MTIQEALAEGLSVTGVGLAIVFAVLIILMLVMMAMKKIFYKDPAKAKAAASVAAPAPAVKAEETKVDEGELIAVLTAAIAASLNTSTYNLQIKSYRRIENKKPAWNKAGVSETINSRY